MSGRKLTFLLITIPIVALFFCFNTLPLIKGVIYSFTNFKGYGSYDWVGLRNYKDLFTDSRVGGSYLFTFKLAIVATIVTNVLSLILALGLNSKIRFKSALRGAYFIPNVPCIMELPETIQTVTERSFPIFSLFLTTIICMI